MKKSLFLIVVCSLFTMNLMARDYVKQSKTADTIKKENYTVFGKSEKIATLKFNKNKKSTEQVLTIRFGYPTPISGSSNPTGIQSSKSYGDTGESPEIKDVLILAGKYEDMKVMKANATTNKYTLTGLTFPLRLKIISSFEVLEFELKEAGKWNIDIELKNN